MGNLFARRGATWLTAGTGLLLLVQAAGCHRIWYREDADKQAAALIREKSFDARWCFSNLSPYMDPRSRYYDPTDPDHSPMPQDDPASDELMRRVDHKKGSKHWFKDGVRDEIENPGWRHYLDERLELTEDGRYVLRLNDAIALAYLESPTYQSNVEAVYLTALDVAFERFRFDVQFFGGLDTFFDNFGKDADLRPLGTRGIAFPPAPTGIDSNTLDVSTGLTLHKLFPTGAELFINFANSLLWQYAGNDSQQTLSLLNFNLIQPLLRFGGREVVLERLTRVERELLSNLRALGRYRETFFTQIAVGDEATGGPKRAGSFLGGAGLERGFSGIGIGGFGGAGEVTGFGRLGFTFGGGPGAEATGSGFVGSGAGLVGGFIGLAQLQQELLNREANLTQILREKARMEALREANRIDAFQVLQFDQSVQTQLSQMLKTRDAYQTQVDSFLLGLGLPPDVPVQIDDPVIKQFEFFDTAMSGLNRKLTDYAVSIRQLVKPTAATVAAALGEGAALQKAAAAQAAGVRKDYERAVAQQEVRLQAPATDKERADLKARLQKLGADLDQIDKEMAQTGQALARVGGLVKEDAAKAAEALKEVADALLDQVGRLALVQAGARVETVTVPGVELSECDAYAIAQEYRLDWMNQRAALVDQWRLIGFNANLLESDLNIVFSGDLETPIRHHPFDFRAARGHLAAGIQFDPPLTRQAEENTYREALINFQQLRRSYIQYTDGVKFSLRMHLRTLAEARANLEMQRNSFNIALDAFKYTRLKLQEPPRPGEMAGPTTARDLLGALSDLLGAQNNFMSVWLQYETARMRLYRDLGVMQFDEHGNWVDEPLDKYLLAVQCKAEGKPAEDAPPEPEAPALPPPTRLTPQAKLDETNPRKDAAEQEIR